MTVANLSGSGSPDADVNIEAALAAGRAHEDAGRLVDAVTEYDRAHRLRPDAELASRIINLRYELMRGRTFGPGPPRWPREMQDPFPGLSGPPEITPDALTADTLGGAILHHGCLIVRGFHEEVRANQIRAMVSRTIDARDRTVAEQPEPGDEAWYRRFLPTDWDTGRERRWIMRNGGMLMVDSPLVMWDVLDGYARTGAIDAITEYFGEPAALSSHKSVLRKVLEFVPTWHQDGSFMGSAVRSVNVWLALSPCGPGTDAAGLDILPQRVNEILDCQTHGATYAFAIGPGLVDEVGGDRPWISPRFAPGDAVFFDERFVHRSSALEGATAPRFAIESWFFAVSTVPELYVPLLV